MNKDKRLVDLTKNATLERISLSLLQLDRENPRIQFAIDSKLARGAHLKDISESDVKFSLIVKTRPTYQQLKDSIESTGGLIEPIWVYKELKKYVVVEGNTRVLVYRDLSEKYPGDTRWKTIEAKILPVNISTDAINFIRLEFHLGGRQPWDPYERARYLYSLYNKGYTYERLARESRTKKTEIEKDLKAFEVMNKYFLTKYKDKTTNPLNKYSYFVELVGNRKIQTQLNLGTFSIDDFSKWVAEEKIPRAIDVRYLPVIFSEDDVAKEFKDKGFEFAMNLLSTKRPNLTIRLFRDIESVIDQLEKLKVFEIREIKVDETRRGILNKLIQTAKEVID